MEKQYADSITVGKIIINTKTMEAYRAKYILIWGSSDVIRAFFFFFFLEPRLNFIKGPGPLVHSVLISKISWYYQHFSIGGVEILTLRFTKIFVLGLPRQLVALTLKDSNLYLFIHLFLLWRKTGS